MALSIAVVADIVAVHLYYEDSVWEARRYQTFPTDGPIRFRWKFPRNFGDVLACPVEGCRALLAMLVCV
jgi:hypothetical protein